MTMQADVTMTPTTYDTPIPDITGINAPYWQGTQLGELRLQCCRECDACWYPANGFCPECLGRDFEWTPASGKGMIAARIFVHRADFGPFAADVPYNVAWIELDEGPMITANIIGASKEEIEVGRRVQVVFDAVAPEVVIPRFRLA